MSAEYSAPLPKIPTGYTPSTTNPLGTGDFRSIGKLNEFSAVFEGSRFNINSKDGSIHSVSVQSFSELRDGVEGNVEIVKILDVAVKILIGEGLSDSDLYYEASARKVADYYQRQAGFSEVTGPSSEKIKGHIAKSFSELRAGLKKQITAAKARQEVLLDPRSRQEARKETQAWGRGKELPSRQVISKKMRDIHKDAGHGPDGQDFHRHLQSGVVSLTKKDGGDAFKQREVSTVNVSELKTEEEKVEAFVQRLEVVMQAFRDVIVQSSPDAGSKIDEEIDELVNAIRKSSNNAGSERVEEKMNGWRHGKDKDLHNLARLAFTLSQSFHMGPLSQPILGCLKSDFGVDDTPGARRGLGGQQFKLDPASKKIEIILGSEGDVEVRHKMSVRQTKPENSTVRIDLTVTLSSNGSDLRKWDHSIQTEVHSERIEDLPTEQIIRSIYHDLNIPVAN